MIAPFAQLASLGLKVSRFPCYENGFPDRRQHPFEAEQFTLVRGVGQGLFVREVHQLELSRDNATHAHDDQGVELHLEKRLCLGEFPRSFARLVVHHAHHSVGRHVDAVYEAAQRGPVVEIDLDALLARFRIESSRVFHLVIPRDEATRLLEQCGEVVVGNEVGDVRRLGADTIPRGLDETDCGVRMACRGGHPVQRFECCVNHGAFDLCRGRLLGDPVDGPKPVEQRTLFEVAGA